MHNINVPSSALNNSSGTLNNLDNLADMNSYYKYTTFYHDGY